MRVRIDERKIKILMAVHGIDTQRELAKRAGLHESTIVDIMNGAGFKSQTLEKLATALECNPVELLTTDGYPSKYDKHDEAPVFAA